MSKKQKAKGKRRAVGNHLGKLIFWHSEASMELVRAKTALKRLKLMAVEDGDSTPYQADIEMLKERCGALSKLVADLYEDIHQMRKAQV